MEETKGLITSIIKVNVIILLKKATNVSKRNGSIRVHVEGLTIPGSNVRQWYASDGSDPLSVSERVFGNYWRGEGWCLRWSYSDVTDDGECTDLPRHDPL